MAGPYSLDQDRLSLAATADSDSRDAQACAAGLRHPETGGTGCLSATNQRRKAMMTAAMRTGVVSCIASGGSPKSHEMHVQICGSTFRITFLRFSASTTPRFKLWSDWLHLERLRVSALDASLVIG